ncbi:MAG: peptide-methionine (S)-S-oxide reductase MsrA [Vallitaleaceae bacterium]|nr:peptide-methionine (S)-S-oxide reductase MsrA [Vallitaleaceae bacterium]
MKKIVLAGGCFWGVEEFFSRIPGVLTTKVGYSNGIIENPTYEMVCSGSTLHAEACALEYDETIVSLEEILNQFWSVVDPTVLNRQGHDKGTQYRTGIYYSDAQDLKVIESSVAKEALKYSKPIVTEVTPLVTFFDAETYHQKYLKKNPGGYCHIPGL